MAGVWDTPPTEQELAGTRTSVWDSPPTAEEMAGHPSENPSNVSKAASLGRGGGQGATLGFGDEINGAIQTVPDYFERSWDEMTGARPVEWNPLQKVKHLLEQYRVHRDSERRLDAEAKKAHGGYYLAGEIGGGAMLPIPGGVGGVAAKGGMAALKGAIATGAALGGAYGLGSSESDLTKGEVGGAVADTAIGTAGGAVGGALGHGIAKTAGIPLAKVKMLMDKLKGRASRGVEEAEARAVAMAAEKVDENIGTLRAKGRAEVQKASRGAENIRRIPGTDDMGASEAQANHFRRVAEAARKRAAEIQSRVKSSGMADVVDGGAALIDPSARAGKALKSRDELEKLLTYADEAEALAFDLDRGLAQPINAAGMSARREAALKSPELAAVENMVLRNNIDDLPGQAAVADAAMGAARRAQADRGTDVAKGAQNILSGRAAMDAVKARVLRYGPPLAASAAGAAFGGPVGAVVGGAAGMLAGRGFEALAGAGLRPALRSWINLFTKYPAVQARTWGAVRTLASTNPMALGEYGAHLARAASRGPEALEAAHLQLLKVPGYLERLADLMEGQEGEPMERRASR